MYCKLKINVAANKKSLCCKIKVAVGIKVAVKIKAAANKKKLLQKSSKNIMRSHHGWGSLDRSTFSWKPAYCFPPILKMFCSFLWGKLLKLQHVPCGPPYPYPGSGSRYFSCTLFLNYRVGRYPELQKILWE